MPSGQRRILALTGLLLVLLPLVGCGGNSGSSLILGATTSLQNTGLLDELVSAFENESGYSVTPVVAGSGQVLELARRGEIDVLITHSPDAENQLVADGDGVDRTPFLENLFIIVGPADDPADLSTALTPSQAFTRIADGGHDFISRGDQSGTHARELEIWAEAGIKPQGQPWYMESATGQGQNLLIASDRGAHTLVDSATFTVFHERTDMVPYVFEGERLRNRYAVTRVNPDTHSGLNSEAALALADFLTSPEWQLAILDFGRQEYGESLFTPVSFDTEASITADDPSSSR